MERAIVTYTHGCASGDELAFLDRELATVPKGASVRVRLELPNGRELEAGGTYEISASNPQQPCPLLSFPTMQANSIPEGTQVSILQWENDG